MRDITESDRPFIYNSFLKNYRKSFPIKLIPNTIYFTGQEKIIDFLLSTAKIAMAVFPEDADALMGYIIYEHYEGTPIIHYIYIRESYRRQGIASKLIEAIILPSDKLCIYTHLTDVVKHVRHKIPDLRFVFDPFYINNKRLLWK